LTGAGAEKKLQVAPTDVRADVLRRLLREHALKRYARPNQEPNEDDPLHSIMASLVLFST
jgi:hypothetical protein